MMLDCSEINVAKELLNYVDLKDLFSLTKTTTEDAIIPTTREEAVRAIILHTDSLELLTSRKKLTKEVLFKYLHDKGQPVSMAADKDALRNKVLELAGRVRRRLERPPRKDSASSDDSGAASGGDSESEPEVKLPLATACEVGKVELRPYLPVTDVTNDFPVGAFSDQFVGWFYDRLNARDLGPEHFWSDAVAEVVLQPGQQVSRGMSSQEVSQLMGWIHTQLGLLFNPNKDLGGVRGKADPHGLVVVLVCGTLHVTDRCVGTFTQQFALARDPFSDNNWKVKNTRVVLRQAAGPSPLPALDSSNPDLALIEAVSVGGFQL